MIYYIADCHFGHRGVLDFDKRPFPDVAVMNKYMVDAWNNRVKGNDDVIVVGDLSFMNQWDTQVITSQLKGRITLVRGNHDKFSRGKGADLTRFTKVVDYLDMSDNGRRVICSHYPMLCYPFQYRGAFMMFGHVHNNMEMTILKEAAKSLRSSGIPCRMVNCFCGYSGFVPLTLDEWLCIDDAVL